MKIVLISGGSDGLGRAIAEKLSKDYGVVILAPDNEKTAQVAKEIGCDFIIADVSNYGQLEKAVSSIIEKHGVIDCLINSAGLWIQGPLETNDPEQIKRVIDVNSAGTIFLTRAVLPYMKLAKRGMIINVISQAGLNAKAERTVYNASKWAITGFTKSLAEELTGTGVTVTGFYPGSMKTDLFVKAGIEKDVSKFMELSDVVRAIEFIIETPEELVVSELGIKPTWY